MLSWGQKDYRKNKLKYIYKNILSRCNNPNRKSLNIMAVKE